MSVSVREDGIVSSSNNLKTKNTSTKGVKLRQVRLSGGTIC